MGGKGDHVVARPVPHEASGTTQPQQRPGGQPAKVAVVEREDAVAFGVGIPLGLQLAHLVRMAVGEVHELVRIARQVVELPHVVLERRATGGVPFAAVEDSVRRFLTMRTIAQTIDSLKEDEDVLYFLPDNSRE